jgi:hypothetical protein
LYYGIQTTQPESFHAIFEAAGFTHVSKEETQACRIRCNNPGGSFWNILYSSKRNRRSNYY